MELTVYNIFMMISAFFMAKNKAYSEAFAWGGILTGVIWIILFVLQGLGLYAMAKNRGIKKLWLAFVPFANIYFLGRLTGDCDVFGRKLKRTWLYALIGQVLTVLLTAGMIFAQVFL